MRKKILIGAGVFLLALTAVWQFGFVPRLTQRIPPGWSWKAEFIGFVNFADPQTGMLAENDQTNIYKREMSVGSENDRPRVVTMEDSQVSLDPATGEKTWEYKSSAEIDPQTGAHLNKEFAGDIYVFPRFVEKKTYNFRNNYINGLPLAFEREEEIAGVETYLFAYRGRAEYTASYAGTADFPGIVPEAGQEIRCGDDQFVFQLWVEPVTGEIIKLDEGCLSGDYFYAKAANERLALIETWAGTTAGDDDVRRADAVSGERFKLLLISRYIPLIMLLAGLLCFGLSLIPEKSLENIDV